MTYVYRCKECNTEFKIVASVSEIDNVEKKCPYCKSKKVGRVYLPTNFILIGDGFYKNDNKKKNDN